MGWTWSGIALVVGREQRRTGVHFPVAVTGSKGEVKIFRPMGQVKSKHQTQDGS